MHTFGEVQEVFPCPIKIEICCGSTDFRMAVRNSFEELLIKHNKNYDTKIEHIIRHYVDCMEENDCQILVGEEVVHSIKSPVFADDISYDVVSQANYFRSIVLITEQVLNIWHDKIIKIQEENNKKLEEYKMEGYDEMLYNYYLIRSDSRAFFYLKKLAARYPNSYYMSRLRRVYRDGINGWHEKNSIMSNKIRHRLRRESMEGF